MKKLQDALVAIRRTPYQSLLAVFMVSITFFVGFVFSLLVIGTNETLTFFETRPQVIAFFDLETEADQVKALSEKMQEKSYVEEVKIVSKQEALSYYQEENRENPLLLELVTADILPASIEVSASNVESLQQIQDDLTAATGVEEVVYQEDIVSNLKRWTNSIRTIGLAATIVLTVVSFLVITVVISMKVANRKLAIRTMKIIGATSWFVMLPFILEGVLYGLVGASLGWMGMYGLLLYSTSWIQEFMGSILSLPLPFELLGVQAGIGAVVGIILGGLASMVAVKRVLRKR